MARNDFRNYMAPEFQAQQGPALDWMPWQENTMEQDMGNISDQLKLKLGSSGNTKGGMMPGAEGKAGPMAGGGGKGSL